MARILLLFVAMALFAGVTFGLVFFTNLFSQNRRRIMQFTGWAALSAVAAAIVTCAFVFLLS